MRGPRVWQRCHQVDRVARSIGTDYVCTKLHRVALLGNARRELRAAVMARVVKKAPAALAVAIALAVSSPGARGEDLSTYDGPSLYKVYCASCHGSSGRGDGPVASSLKGEVPDLTRIARRQGHFPAERIRSIIDGRTTVPPHGTREMPVWGHEFRAAATGGAKVEPESAADRLVDLLVEYLRSIQVP